MGRKDIKKKGSNEGGNVGGSGISAVVGMGDDETGDCTQVFQDWMERVVGRLSEEDMYGCGKVKESTGKGIKVKTGRQKQSKISNVKDEDGSGCGCGKDEETGGGGCCQSTTASDPYGEDEEGGGGCCSSPPDDEVENDEETYDSTDDSDDETTGSEPSVMDLEDMGSAMHDQKNPVGREWRWKTDDPGMIVDQAVIEHVNMIKE